MVSCRIVWYTLVYGRIVWYTIVYFGIIRIRFIPSFTNVLTITLAFLLVFLLVSVYLIFDEDESHTHDWLELNDSAIPSVDE